MRPNRDWEYKKIKETDGNQLEIFKAMRKEEKEEVQSILSSCPGLKEYIESGKTYQDFLDEYETLGWDIRYSQFKLVWEEHLRKTIDDPLEVYHRICDKTPEKIPDYLIWKYYVKEVPDKYRKWGFALYFSDNDFGMVMERAGKIVGRTYLDDFKNLLKSTIIYENTSPTIAEECKEKLDKYFHPEKIKEFLVSVYPAANFLVSWNYRGEADTEEEVKSNLKYLNLPGAKMKIGNLDELKEWIKVEFNWGQGDTYWCNGEMLLVYINDNELTVTTW